jgi:hypothetical protein
MDYKGKRYETGDIIEMPPYIAARHVELGRLKPVVRPQQDGEE